MSHLSPRSSSGVVRTVGVLVAVLFLAAPAEPTSVKRLSHSELVQHAGTIVHGDCVSVRTEWSKDRKKIFTYVRLASREVLKGTSTPELTLKLPGGVVGTRAYVIHGMPRFRAGQEVVLYATRPHPKTKVCVPVGLGQGVYEIDRSGRGVAVAKRDTRKLHLVDLGRKRVRSSRGTVNRTRLDSLLRSIRVEVKTQAKRRAKKKRR